MEASSTISDGSDPSSGINEAIVLQVLDVVERDSSVTQRSVARELGIALGLANAYLKRCVRKGLIKISQAPARRYAYYLTPQGFAEKSRLTAEYLTHSFEFFRRARSQCGELFADARMRGHHRLVLVGSGDLAELAGLVARDHGIEVVGVIEAESNASKLAVRIAAFDSVDAVVVTALSDSRETFAAALSAFGVERVYAPAMLRIPMSVRVTAEAGQ